MLLPLPVIVRSIQQDSHHTLNNINDVSNSTPPRHRESNPNIMRLNLTNNTSQFERVSRNA